MNKYRVYVQWTGDFDIHWDVDASSPEDAMNIMNNSLKSRKIPRNLYDTLGNTDSFATKYFQILSVEELYDTD